MVLCIRFCRGLQGEDLLIMIEFIVGWEQTRTVPTNCIFY